MTGIWEHSLVALHIHNVIRVNPLLPDRNIQLVLYFCSSELEVKFVDSSANDSLKKVDLERFGSEATVMEGNSVLN